MIRWRRSTVAAVAAIFAAGWAGFVARPRPLVPCDVVAAAHAPAVPLALAGFEPETRRRAAEVAATLALRPRAATPWDAAVRTGPDASCESEQVQTARALAPTFASLYAQHDYFDHDVIYAQIFAALAEDSANVAAAARLLTDPDFLGRAIGSDAQAVSRVFAIHFLEHCADRGDLAPLVATTRKLYAALAARGEQVRGQFFDVEALIRATLERQYDAAELRARPGEVVRSVLLNGEEGRLPPASAELRRSVAAAFWGVLLHDAEDMSALRRVADEISAALQSG